MKLASLLIPAGLSSLASAMPMNDLSNISAPSTSASSIDTTSTLVSRGEPNTATCISVVNGNTICHEYAINATGDWTRDWGRSFYEILKQKCGRPMRKWNFEYNDGNPHENQGSGPAWSTFFHCGGPETCVQESIKEVTRQNGNGVVDLQCLDWNHPPPVLSVAFCLFMGGDETCLQDPS